MRNDKKALHSLLASRLTHLHIPSAAAASIPEDPSLDFEFSDFFGPAASSSPSSSSAALFLGEPPVIHNRSHSFLGPSPRFTLSKSLPPFERDELYYSSSDDTGNNTDANEASEEDGGRGFGVVEKGGDEGVKKVGPGDFEIMRVIGKGAFGKVFQVRVKGNNGGGGDGDGIFAMKVMRKDTIIKNNHVDYMRAERDILTKVVHPFIVQLRYSFQVVINLRFVLLVD